MPTVTRTRVDVAGAQLSVLVAGDGGPLVLLHGIPTGAELWRELLTPLADAGYRVLAPDLPGYGATRLPPQGDHSLAGAAELLARWLTEAGAAPARIVGHDAGGAVAQLLAVRHPRLVSQLTLTNSIVDGWWPAPRARFATLAARAGLYAPAARLRLVPNAYVRREIRRGFAEPARMGRRDLDRVFWDTKFTDPQGRAVFQRHLAALTPKDTAAVCFALPHLAIPSQLVWGMADPFQTWETAGHRLRALLPSAEVVHLDHCGHFTPLECPDRLRQALLGAPAQEGPRGPRGG